MPTTARQDAWLFATLGWDPTMQRRMSGRVRAVWTVAVVCVWIAVGGLALLALYYMPSERRWLPLTLVVFAWVVFAAIQTAVRYQVLAQIDAHEEQVAARRIQARLLPTKLPSIDGLDLAAHYSPFRQIGGDYYDVVRLDDRRALVAVADVSGKGTAAALLTANVQALVHFAQQNELTLDQIAGAINRHLLRHTESSRFVTMVLAIVDLGAGSLQYVNAGHNPPLGVDSAGQPLRLDATGLPLGMLEESAYMTAEIAIGPGTRLLFYTDGLTERMNRRDDMFGLEGVTAALEATPGGTAGELVDSTIDAVTRFAHGAEPDDDTTLLAIGVA